MCACTFEEFTNKTKNIAQKKGVDGESSVPERQNHISFGESKQATRQAGRATGRSKQKATITTIIG
jgi:hypothetical protein